MVTNNQLRSLSSVSTKPLYTVTFSDVNGDTQRVERTFERLEGRDSARSFASRITWGTDVKVWQGQPGGQHV